MEKYSIVLADNYDLCVENNQLKIRITTNGKVNEKTFTNGQLSTATLMGFGDQLIKLVNSKTARRIRNQLTIF